MNRRHKFNARKTIVDDITFDSALEARRYSQLKLLEQNGDIDHLELQPTYELVPKFTDRDGKTKRPINYVADFRYVENGNVIVEEVKGHKTAVWRLKYKMFLFYYRELELRVLGKDDIG